MSKLTASTPVLLIMVGLPGAGRTETASKLAEKLGAMHLQLDEVASLLDHDKYSDQIIHRLGLGILDKFLGQGISLVWDGGAYTKRERQELRRLARAYDYKVLIIWLQVDRATAVRRSERRNRSRASNKFASEMDNKSFAETVKRFERPEFEDYVVISGKHAFRSQFASIRRKMTEMRLLIDEETKLVAKSLPKRKILDL